MRITGQLPVSDAALLTAQLDALMPDASTYTATGEAASRDARRADALVLLTQKAANTGTLPRHCLLYTSPSPRDKRQSRMPSSA